MMEAPELSALIRQRVAANAHLARYVGRAVAFVACGRRRHGRVRKVACAYEGKLEIDAGVIWIVKEDRLRSVAL